ncbi:MAG: glycosyltransferase, partial [Verrucomicrobiota bacterium]
PGRNVMRETFCQAMVQGMLSGLPVIANKLQVLTEKLDQGGGLVFSTTEDLTRAMDQLFRDKPLREHMGNQARTTAKNRYIWRTADFLERYC